MVPKTAEQCASSLHHHFEEYVNGSELRMELAQQGDLFAVLYLLSPLCLFLQRTSRSFVITHRLLENGNIYST